MELAEKQQRLDQLQQFFWSKRVGAVVDIQKIIKNQIYSIEITKEDAIVNLNDGRAFYWDITKLYSLGYLLRDGIVEAEEYDIVMKLVEPGDVVFDIGANYGWYSSLFAKLVGSGGKVYSFEPVEPTYRELGRNIELNNLENVEQHQIALSDYQGESTMYFPIKNGSADAALLIDMAEEHITFTCEVQTMDAFIGARLIDKIDFVKIDIEGGELRTLHGFEQFLSNHAKPVLMLEAIGFLIARFGNSLEELFQFLQRHGYRVFQSIGGKLHETSSTGELESEVIFCLQHDHMKRFQGITFSTGGGAA